MIHQKIVIIKMKEIFSLCNRIILHLILNKILIKLLQKPIQK